LEFCVGGVAAEYCAGIGGGLIGMLAFVGGAMASPLLIQRIRPAARSAKPVRGGRP
jgi:hypothetical protein